MKLIIIIVLMSSCAFLSSVPLATPTFSNIEKLVDRELLEWIAPGHYKAVHDRPESIVYFHEGTNNHVTLYISIYRLGLVREYHRKNYTITTNHSKAYCKLENTYINRELTLYINSNGNIVAPLSMFTPGKRAVFTDDNGSQIFYIEPYLVDKILALVEKNKTLHKYIHELNNEPDEKLEALLQSADQYSNDSKEDLEKAINNARKRLAIKELRGTKAEQAKADYLALVETLTRHIDNGTAEIETIFNEIMLAEAIVRVSDKVAQVQELIKKFKTRYGVAIKEFIAVHGESPNIKTAIEKAAGSLQLFGGTFRKMAGFHGDTVMLLGAALYFREKIESINDIFGKN